MRASGQKTFWLVDGVHWSARPVVPCAQAATRFFLLLVGVMIRPVAVIRFPLTSVVRYWMRLPVASVASSGGRVAVVELSTMPGSDAAAAGPAGATRAAPTANRTATR